MVDLGFADGVCFLVTFFHTPHRDVDKSVMTLPVVVKNTHGTPFGPFSGSIYFDVFPKRVAINQSLWRFVLLNLGNIERENE